MTVCPADRLKVDDALVHPWLSGVPCFCESLRRDGFVSLRHVDNFFRRDWSEERLLGGRPLRPAKSDPSLGLGSLTRLITHNTPQQQRRPGRRAFIGAASSNLSVETRLRVSLGTGSESARGRPRALLTLPEVRHGSSMRLRHFASADIGDECITSRSDPTDDI